MATAVYLDRSVLESVYLLWHLLTNTEEEIISYMMHLPGRTTRTNLASLPSADHKSKTAQIADKLKTIRAFTSETLTIANYDPAWTSINSLELIHKASSTNSITTISLPDTADTVGDPSSILLRKANATIFNLEKRAGTSLNYPLTTASKGMAHATASMPLDILDLVDDSKDLLTIAERKNILAAGSSVASLFAIEKSLYDETHARYGLDSDATWFIDSDWILGSISGRSRKSFLKQYPYYKYITL